MYWDSMKSCDLLGRGNGTKLSDDSLTNGLLIVYIRS